MPILSRDDILKARDIATEVVPVPEWGGEVIVSGLSGAERDAFEESILIMRQKKVSYNLDNIRSKLCSLGIKDESGARIFSDSDVEALGRKSAAALDRVFTAIQRLSALSPEDIDRLQKN